MRKFHHRRSQGGFTGQDPGDRLVLHIAAEKQTRTRLGIADESDRRDDRLVVGGAAGLARHWMNDGPRKVPEPPPTPARRLHDLHIELVHPIQPVRDRRPRARPRPMQQMRRHDESSDLEPPHDGRDAVEVVGIGMGHHECVQPLNAERPQHRSDDPMSGIIDG